MYFDYCVYWLIIRLNFHHQVSWENLHDLLQVPSHDNQVYMNIAINLVAFFSIMHFVFICVITFDLMPHILHCMKSAKLHSHELSYLTCPVPMYATCCCTWHAAKIHLILTIFLLVIVWCEYIQFCIVFTPMNHHFRGLLTSRPSSEIFFVLNNFKAQEVCIKVI